LDGNRLMGRLQCPDSVYLTPELQFRKARGDEPGARLFLLKNIDDPGQYAGLVNPTYPRPAQIYY